MTDASALEEVLAHERERGRRRLRALAHTDAEIDAVLRVAERLHAEQVRMTAMTLANFRALLAWDSSDAPLQ